MDILGAVLIVGIIVFVLFAIFMFIVVTAGVIAYMRTDDYIDDLQAKKLSKNKHQNTRR